MKIAGIIAALALASAPMLASAQSTDDDDDDQIVGSLEPGGVSQSGVLPAFSLNNIPAGAVVVGSVVVIAGVIIGSVLTRDSTVSTSN